MPDLELVTANGPQRIETVRVFTLLHGRPPRGARPVLLNFGEPGSFDITPWATRVQLLDAKYPGAKNDDDKNNDDKNNESWELPALGAVAAPSAVLIRPDGYVAWVGDRTQQEGTTPKSQPKLTDALTTWFGSPAAVSPVKN